MHTLPRLLAPVLCGLVSACAQDNLFDPLFPFATERPQAGRMPPQGQHGPWQNDVIVYHAMADGTVERLAVFERAGVPTINRMKDGRLIAAHQHFPENDPSSFDKVAIHFSSDEGRTWTPAAVMKLNGLPEGMRFPFDPTLVPLPDGRVRMYFTSLLGRQFDEDLPRIHSAISNDGVEYTFESGVRFSIEGRSVIDCAVALHQGIFHLFSPDNGRQPEPGQRPNNGPQMQPADGIGYHATSADGLNFTRADDVKIDGRRRWLGNAQSDGKVITFFGTGDGIFIATSPDGTTWQLADSPAVMGADPGAVAAKEGGWIVAVTGPPRDDRRGQRRQEQQQPPIPNRGTERREQREERPQIRVEKIESKYAVASKQSSGRFSTGQAADVMLGGFGFNQSGGALALNHPTGLATDGKRLLVADRWNNRVLVWTEIPSSNTPPQLVLGQGGFATNNPGREMNSLSWPGNVAIGKNGQIAVTDTNNDRVLLWNAFPTQNGQRADVALNLESLSSREDRMRMGWPWGVWTDGTKLAVVATHGGAILIWNAWPARDDTPPDFVLRPQNAGTPRNVTSDGTYLMVSDHNYRGVTRPGPQPQNNNGGGMSGGPATAVWNAWPTRSEQAPDFHWREWCKGSPTPDGGLVLAGIQSVFVWNKRPLNAETDPDVMLTPQGYRNGDGPDAVIAGGRLFVCNYNGCNILAWNTIPKSDNTPPDFALGSETPTEDVWSKRFNIQNPIVATNGTSLFVSSDFDRKLFVWKQLPAESGARPDLVYHLPDGPWDNALHDNTLVLGGKDALTIWITLPLDGQPPDVTLRRRIGSIELREVTGVAVDSQHLYVADRQANKVYIWRGIPTEQDEPLHVLDVQNPGRMSSDGTWLTIAPFEGQEITFFKVANLAQHQPEGWLGGRGMFNLPGKAIVSHGRLFVANTSFHRVDVWHDVNDAINGAPADAYLGAENAMDHQPGISASQMFMPGSLAYDGTRLWVGEFKFSTRILRFSPTAQSTSGTRPNAPSPRRESAITDWGAFWSQGRAQGTGMVRFTHPPMRVADIQSIVPYGLMAGGHVCPIDHGYFFPKTGVTAEVLAPADGFIVMIAHRTQLRGSTEHQRDYDDYALTLEHSGTHYSLYDLISSLDETILGQLDAATRARFANKQPGPPLHVRIAVIAGQKLGTVSGRSLDFSVVNTQTRLPGLLHPESYGHYAWRAHMADMFEFFDGDLKSQLLALNVRNASPFGGKIDFDIAGHLAGNWFREGSGGYSGDRSDPRDYWMGHLAFVLHHLDPKRVILSIGDFDGHPRQFSISGNAPDPEKITAKDGLVKFELVYTPLDNLGRAIELPPEMRGVQGVALAQVLEGEKMRFEVFPGAGETRQGFTEKARMFER